MRKLVVGSALLGLIGSFGVAHAEIGTADVVPASTLLLPYFEVNLASTTGINTVMSVNNASATAAVAHVTLWTDEAIPTLGFDLYLTGFDVVNVNLRDIFNGVLPLTADDGADPVDNNNNPDGISNQGPLSQDINFPGGVGPCGNAATLYGQPDPSLATKIDHIRKAHTGQASPVFGGRCAGANYGDQIARGYVTVDTVTQCNLEFPSGPAYFSGIASYQNILWGDYFYVNSAEANAQGEALVHIEACQPGNGYLGFVGNGAGNCPFVPGDYTFYGRYVDGLGSDQREPLPTTFASRYLTTGTFPGLTQPRRRRTLSGGTTFTTRRTRRTAAGSGTDFIVWRDTRLAPAGPNGPHTCGSFPTWFPLVQTDIVAFDEAENVTDACFTTDNVAPPIGGTDPCFPLATQRVHATGNNAIGTDLNIPYASGWLFMNLNTTVTGSAIPPFGVSQSWVTTVMQSSGRFTVGYQAIAFDNALTAAPGGVIFIP